MCRNRPSTCSGWWWAEVCRHPLRGTCSATLWKPGLEELSLLTLEHLLLCWLGVQEMGTSRPGCPSRRSNSSQSPSTATTRIPTGKKMRTCVLSVTATLRKEKTVLICPVSISSIPTVLASGWKKIPLVLCVRRISSLIARGMLKGRGKVVCSLFSSSTGSIFLDNCSKNDIYLIILLHTVI